MRPIEFAHQSRQSLLLRPFRRVHREAMVDEIVEAAQLLEPVLPSELVEPWYPSLAVSNNVQGNHIDLASRRLQTGHFQVLQELRIILQGELSGALASHGERPVG